MGGTAGGTAPGAARRRAVLDPIERSSEVLFGLIMVLSFTGSISVADAERDEVRSVLIGALGCNLAWGIVDALMYLINSVGERGRELKIARGIRAAKTPEEARAVIADALPGSLEDTLRESDLDAIAARVRAREKLPESPRFHAGDLRAAFSIFLIVFFSTLPVVVPFALMEHTKPAMRVSNSIAVVMLYLTGHSLGRYAFRRPWAVGVSMVVIGLVLVSITMALGG